MVPCAGFAFHFDAAAMRFDDRLAVIEADPEAPVLGGFERVEQFFADELLGHAAAVVGDGEHHAIPFSAPC